MRKENWTYKKLGEVAYYPSKRIATKDLKSFSFVGVENLIKNKGGVSFSESLPNIDTAIEYQKDDILIGNIRPYLKKIWKADNNGGASGDVVIVRINKEYACLLDAKYLYKVLSTDYFFDYDNSNTKGAKMPRGDRKVIAKYIIPIPPLSTQSRIVSELDLLQSIIDKQKTQLKELDNLAQSIFYDVFGDPVENEKGWEVKKFGELFKLKSGDGLSTKSFVEGNVPVYGGNGISGYHNKSNKHGKYIIIGRVGVYCGNSRYVNDTFWLTDNAFELIFSDKLFDYRWLNTLLNALNLTQYANHAAQPVISNTGLKDIVVIHPPLSLQQSFAQKIESIERQKELINQSIREAQTLFDSRMEYYFGE